MALGGLGLAPSAQALPARALAFPRDFGSHPGLRTEWWYLTGWAAARQEPQRLFGFQLTFFRARVDAAQGLRSAFAARQLLFAHAALTDVQGRRLWHDQRIARAGFGVAEADEADTAVRLRDWSLARTIDVGGRSRYRALLPAQDFTLDLAFDATQPVLPQGEAGLSRKGPQAAQVSYYYSEPQLVANGAVTLRGQRFALAGVDHGRAWLDHEWSEELLHPEAVGWDWIGMNLQGGGALTAFRLRRRDGTALWAGGSFRAGAQAATQVFGPADVAFTPRRHWISAATGARYPVAWVVATPAGTFAAEALLDDQELDSRATTGAVYWEGLSDLHDAQGRAVGRGYLEMTGYAQPLRLG
ncbi:carotenoid 1,2-hydratase [Ramlibacter sp. H39-3-26]|uniref:lipocalin-like domain-containing protein n=1 Tax=Curvibacter soli TaxID=3031331 RepID=UPI0023DAD97B|nr:carotenoid 1,2-hydratase [Ramlibacter sp. H39-3-26]MDF1484440.1 carotenoid 1,2-hydratase [Ramlibacter sp. H39-3-26]